jgi:GGDEF domain-containing protein
LNLAFQPTGAAALADAFCPRIAGRFAFAPGALSIGGAAAVLLVAALSTIHVQLVIATVGALLGIWTVRQRALRAVASTTPASAATAPFPSKRGFPEDTRRLSAVGDAMLYKTRKEHRPLSLAVFDFSDLPELQAVFEGRIASGFGALIARRLQLIAPAKGVVVRTGPTTFVVLLPNFDSTRARLAIRSALGRACCIEFDVGNSEILLVPEFTTQTVRSDAESIAQVYRDLRTELARGLQHTERRQAYLKRERESHTRPMRLAPATPMAATMPAQLRPALAV